MNKLFLWIAMAVAVVAQSCEKDDGIRAEIESLKDRVAALESKVAVVNQSLVSLHKLMDETTSIVGVTPTYDDKGVVTGYLLELSEGREVKKYPILLGEKIAALVPTMGIDSEGYWIYSTDGVKFERLLVDGKPVSAYPTNGGKPEAGAAGTTPKLRIDAKGYWEVSIDGGVTYKQLLQGDKPVNALGDNVSITYSIFKAISYANGIFSGELKSGDKFTLPVLNNFVFAVTAKADEKICLGETRAFEVTQKGVAEAVVRVPQGWMARLEADQLVVIAPATFVAGRENIEVELIVTSDSHLFKTEQLKLTLLNQQHDANACLAWQKFATGAAENVLLDFSYAGYKRGEVAPPDVWGLGYKIYDITKYGGDPTGVASSREAFLALLKELKLSGQNDSGANLANASANAIIYFPEGRYILHNEDDNIVDPASKNQIFKDSKQNNKSLEIQIRGGNFVIKGAGRDKTVLVMDSPNLPDDPAQMWSSPMLLNIKSNQGTTKLADVTADAPRGAFSVTVGSIAGVSKGDWVLLRLFDDAAALVAQELAPYAVEGTMSEIKTIKIDDYHQVKSVSGNQITFHEPLLYAVESKWKWEVHKFQHYENVGVEDLAFEGKSKADFTHHGSWEDDGAYKPLNMMRLTDSWLRRVDFRNVSEAATIVTSANCSAYDITITGNRGHSGVRSQGAARVFIGKIIDSSSGKSVGPPQGSGLGTYMANAGQYHASGVSNTALGTVLWNNTWGDDAFFESHSKQPRGTLVDRCTGGFVQWRFGGDESNVPNHLHDLTIWNLNATRVAHDFGGGKFKWWISTDKWWKTLPPTIVGMHGSGPIDFDTDPAQIKYLESNGTAVEPQSLYEAQLRNRLGYVPGWLNSLK